jgi:hypothetical protein
VKTGKKSKEEKVRAAQMEHREHVAALMDQVKASKKLAKNDMHEEKERHSEEVAKLKRQTTGLRNRAKNQRIKHKEMVCAVTAKHAALEALRSVSEVENKKLVRELAAQEWTGATLVTKTEALEERVKTLDILTKRLAEERDKAHEEYNGLLTELQQVRSQLATNKGCRT